MEAIPPIQAKGNVVTSNIKDTEIEGNNSSEILKIVMDCPYQTFWNVLINHKAYVLKNDK